MNTTAKSTTRPSSKVTKAKAGKKATLKGKPVSKRAS